MNLTTYSKVGILLTFSTMLCANHGFEQSMDYSVQMVDPILCNNVWVALYVVCIAGNILLVCIALAAMQIATCIAIIYFD